MITGEQVAARRKTRGLSRRALAEQAGLTEGKIWRIENRGIISDEEAEALAAALPADSAEVPLSPVRAPETQPGPPPAVVGSSQPGGNLILLERPETAHRVEPEVTYDDLECGHTTRDHAAADLCPRHPRNDGVRLVSNSELRTFKRCRRKWWLAWYRGLKPRVESPVGALAIGGRVHRALREKYVPAGQTPVDPRDALEVFITRDWTTVTETYRTNGLEVPLELRKKFVAEADLERAMIEGYVDWLAETGEDSELEVIAPETYLEAEVTSDLIPFKSRTKLIGKLDVRAYRRRDGAKFFIDHKTVSDMRSAVATLPLDEQMQYYMLLEYLHAEAARSTESSQSLDSEAGVPGTQPSETVAVSLLSGDGDDGGGQPRLGSSPPGREPREQLAGKLDGGTPGLSLITSQQRSEASALHSGAPTKDQRGSKTTESRDSEVDSRVARQAQRDTAREIPRFAGTVTALYNMLRKVKRTVTAQPPFYQRAFVHHNWRTLQSFYERTLSTIEDMRLAEEALQRGNEHQRWAYPNATKDCRWDCPFFQACSMFDDGSRVEEMLDQYYVRGDVLAYYTENTGLRAPEGEIV